MFYTTRCGFKRFNHTLLDCALAPHNEQILAVLGHSAKIFKHGEDKWSHPLSIHMRPIMHIDESSFYYGSLLRRRKRGNRFGSEDYSRNSHVASKHLRNAAVESEAIQSFDDAVSVRHSCPHAVYPTYQVSCCLTIFVCCVRTCIKCHWKYHCLKKKKCRACICRKGEKC